MHGGQGYTAIPQGCVGPVISRDTSRLSDRNVTGRSYGTVTVIQGLRPHILETEM